MIFCINYEANLKSDQNQRHFPLKTIVENSQGPLVTIEVQTLLSKDLVCCIISNSMSCHVDEK
jgi:hypothetical protein